MTINERAGGMVIPQDKLDAHWETAPEGPQVFNLEVSEEKKMDSKYQLLTADL